MNGIRRALGLSAAAAVAVGVMAGSASTALAGVPCSPIAVGDYVHVSGTQASGHGWWLKNDCQDNSAEVTVALWELWVSDGQCGACQAR